MVGIIEQLLEARLGSPTIHRSAGGDELIWTHEQRELKCGLYKGLRWNKVLRQNLGILEPIYGDTRAGSLFDGRLKLSAIDGLKVFGIYPFETLQQHRAVQEANNRDPDICFFMDSANVWFYGVKDSNLFVFDAATDELDCLGPIAEQLDEVIAQWADTTAS
jgi:hypothetical protein